MNKTEYMEVVRQACSLAGVELISVTDGPDTESSLNRLTATWKRDGSEVTYHWLFQPGIDTPEGMALIVYETIESILVPTSSVITPEEAKRLLGVNEGDVGNHE